MFWTSDEFDDALHLGTTYLAYALRAVDSTGAVWGWTNIRRSTSLAELVIPLSETRNVVVPATTYNHRAALRVSNLVMSDTPSQVDNMEISLTFGAALPEANARRGNFENAPFWLLIYDWKTPLGGDGVPRAMLRLTGEFGERTIKGQAVTWKLRSLAQKLKGDVLEVSSRDSRARWGDPELLFFNLDGNTHDGRPTRATGTISQVDSDWPRRRFKLESASGYPDDRFEDGLITFSGGALDGVTTGILRYEAGGWLTTTMPTPAPLVVGQGVTAQIRAPRTIDEWILYFNDARLFAGEPGIPTAESATRTTTN